MSDSVYFDIPFDFSNKPLLDALDSYLEMPQVQLSKDIDLNKGLDIFRVELVNDEPFTRDELLTMTESFIDGFEACQRLTLKDLS